MTIDALGKLLYRCHGEDPLSAAAEYQYRIEFSRDDWNVSVECEVCISADIDNFYIKGEYRALEHDELINRRQVDTAVARQFV